MESGKKSSGRLHKIKSSLDAGAKQLDDARTFGGRFPHIPLNDVPKKVRNSVQDNADSVRRLVVVGGVATTLLTTPAESAEKTAPRATTEQKLVVGQLALEFLAMDVAKYPEKESIEDTLLKQDISCLARNIRNEARGESLEGQLAVALVVLARSRDKRFPKTVCGVVYQKHQFSWTNDEAILRAQNEKSIEPIFQKLDELLGNMQIDEAISFLAFYLKLPEKTFYYKRYDWNENSATETRMSAPSKLSWQKLHKIKRIGRHEFYID